MSNKICLLVVNTSWSFIFFRGQVTRRPLSLTINLSWRWDSFNSKLPSNSMSGLLPPALARPLTSPAVWPVIYVYDHLVVPGCHGQQDGNLLINTLSTAFTLQPLLYWNKDNKTVWLSVSAHCFISLNNNILLTQEDDYYAALILELIFNIKKKKHSLFIICKLNWRKSHFIIAMYCTGVVHYSVFNMHRIIWHVSFVLWMVMMQCPLQSQVLWTQIPLQSKLRIQFTWFISFIPLYCQLLLPC